MAIAPTGPIGHPDRCRTVHQRGDRHRTTASHSLIGLRTPGRGGRGGRMDHCGAVKMTKGRYFSDRENAPLLHSIDWPALPSTLFDGGKRAKLHHRST